MNQRQVTGVHEKWSAEYKVAQPHPLGFSILQLVLGQTSLQIDDFLFKKGNKVSCSTLNCSYD